MKDLDLNEDVQSNNIDLNSDLKPRSTIFPPSKDLLQDLSEKW
jgi:hypothetical protein